MLKFHTKTGKLTRYALQCGYLETFHKDRDNVFRLDREHGVYHIKGYVKGKHFWECHLLLKEARKLFNQKKREAAGNI